MQTLQYYWLGLKSYSNNIGGRRGANILLSFKKDPSPEVRERAVANSLKLFFQRILMEKEGSKVVETFYKDPNPKVKLLIEKV